MHDSRTFPGAYSIELSNNGRQAVIVSDVRVRWWDETMKINKFYRYVDVRWGVAVGDAPPQTLPVMVEPGAVINLYTELSLFNKCVERLTKRKPSEVRLELQPQARVGTAWVSRGGYRSRHAAYFEDRQGGRVDW